MSRLIVKTRLSNLRLYKFDVPGESDVGVLLKTSGTGDEHEGHRFKLSRYIGQGRGSKAGLSKSFVNLVKNFFDHPVESNVTSQIFDYIVSNFSFKDLEVIPPACPVLVFHFHCAYGNNVPEVDIVPFTRGVLIMLGTKESILNVEDAITRSVPIAPPTTEIVDCYQSSELCSLCEKGYPKEDEIVYKTRCNHIFHAKCISGYLLSTPHCPVCSAHLPPVDIGTLLFY